MTNDARRHACTMIVAMTQIVVLNGGSSAGKSSIARALQLTLPAPWLTFGVDVLIDALPGRGDDPRSGIVFEIDGSISVTPNYQAIENAWYQGLATMARHGTRLILDEVLLSGAAGQRRLSEILDGLAVLWIGVHCDPLVAARREASRADRIPGMALSQATIVHDGARYDLQVDTTDCSPEACAAQIAERIVPPSPTGVS